MPSFTREELHNLVWSEPMRSVAERLETSATWLKMICVSNKIPTPPRGYWVRAEGRRSSKRPPLPKSLNERKIEVNGSGRRRSVASQDPALLPKLVAETSAPKIVVGNLDEKPRRPTIIAGRALRAAKPDKYGAVASTEPDSFYVRVPPGSIERALGIVQALAVACAERGFTIRPGVVWGHKTAAIEVEGVAVAVEIEETANRSHHNLTPEERTAKARYGYSSAPMYDFRPSGVMQLRLGRERVWKDRPTGRLESRLNDAMVGLIEIAAAAKSKIADEERRAVARKQLELEKVARREAAERESAKIKRLEELADDWSKAERLRLFVATVEAALASGTAAGFDAEWCEWARAYAARLDPIRGGAEAPSGTGDG